VCRKFDLAEAVFRTDTIISLAKMKVHQLTRITGAVKNQLGCVYGLNKPAFHARFPDAPRFAHMLVDLNRLLGPSLFILDGIIAMEGNGPSGGDPVSMNCLIISDDPVAVDSVFCRLISLDPRFVPTNTFGQQSGLGTWDPASIEILGDCPDELTNPDFRVLRAPVKSEKFRYSGITALRHVFIRRPFIEEDKCVRCGICVDTCPLEPKALDFPGGDREKAPRYIYRKCIRCYCCQEMCPEKAISVRTPLLGRLFLYSG
jgi:ferredoxin